MVLFWRGNQSVNEAERSTVQSSEEKQGKGVARVREGGGMRMHRVMLKRNRGGQEAGPVCARGGGSLWCAATSARGREQRGWGTAGDAGPAASRVLHTQVPAVAGC